MKRFVTYKAPNLLLMITLLALLIMTAPLVGCGRPKITVASKMDTEGAILSQLIIQTLRANNFDVTDKTWMASTDDLREALINGDIDIYPEYTGNGAKFFEVREDKPYDPGNWSPEWWDKDTSYDKVNALEKENRTGIEWLRPAPVNNSWAIALNNEVAGNHEIDTMQEFADYINDQNRDQAIEIYGSEEFFTSPTALNLFKWKYQFELKEEKGDRYTIVGSSGYAEQLTAASELFSNSNDVMYAAMAYSTDDYLQEPKLVVLEDDKNAQPWYFPAPVVRSKIFQWDENIRTILDSLFSELDQKTLEKLNYDAGQGGKLPSDVVREYLEKQNDLDDKPPFYQLTDDRPNPDFFEAKQNEKVIEIINTKVTVEPQTLWDTVFYIDGRFMRNVRVVGWVMASGGIFDDVKILVLNDIDFTNWKNFHKTNGIYQSDKITIAQIEEEIKEPGSYHLVINNRFSEFSSKTVLAKVYLYYESVKIVEATS